MPASRSKAAAAVLIALLAGLPVPQADSALNGDLGGATALEAARVQPPPDPLSVAELLSQDLTVWLYPENRSIAVEGSLMLRANSDLNRLTLWLYETLDLLNITQNGEPLLYTRNVEKITVDLAYPLSAGGITNLSFFYNGTMWYTEAGARQDCVGWEGAYLKGSTFWYLRHHASDWFDCRLKICCPPNWTAVADGDLVAEEHSAEWANYTWVNDAPCLRPALAAGNYSVVSETLSDINYSAYTYPEHVALAAGYLEEAGRIMGSYEEKLGPYGRRSFKVVETAHQTSTGYACSGFVMLHPGAFTKGVVDSGLLAHETGHEWFPFSTGYQGWAYPWLWEAFPEYLACLYGPSSGRLTKDYDAYVKVHGTPGLPSIRNSTWDTAYSYEVVYAKGAWVLRMLHGIVGTDFFPLLADYVKAHRWGYGSVSGFIAIAANHSGIDLDGFWEQWLNTTKALDVSFAGARQYDNGTTVRLELEPVNLLVANNPAGMFIEFTNGNSEQWPLAWDGKAKLLVFEVPSTVKQVHLDPESFLLDVDRTNNGAVAVQSGKLYELRPDAPALPENITEGEEPMIRARVHNDGQHLARDVAVDFLVDGCRTARKVVDISAQGWAEASTSWLPREGRHNVTVRVDPGDTLHEWNEGNNNASATVDVGPRPPRLDAWIGELSIGEAMLEGQQYAINVTVQNRGDRGLGILWLEYILDGEGLALRELPYLSVGRGLIVNLPWTATRGYHHLSVRVDPEGKFPEVDEENNVVTCSFFVRWQETLRVNFTPVRPMSLERVTFRVEGDAEEFRYILAGGPASQWTAEREAVHTFLEGGRHIVGFEGRANGWTVGEGSIEVDVANRPPEVSAYHDPASPLSLSAVVFTARTLDLDGRVVTVRWEFGDGTTGNGSRAEHSYARPGNYTVRCTAADNHQGENTTSLRVSIGNRPPEVGWNDIAPAFVGEKLAFTANASDPDGRLTLCRWQFGDGSSAEGLNASHAYAKPGIYLVTVTAYDELGASRNVTGGVEVRARKTAGPAQYVWIWLAVPVIGAVVLASVLIWNRRRTSRQRDDFFRPPPRSGQNP